MHWPGVEHTNPRLARLAQERLIDPGVVARGDNLPLWHVRRYGTSAATYRSGRIRRFVRRREKRATP
jgi:hypothetical protein